MNPPFRFGPRLSSYAFAGVALLTGCGFMRTPYLLKTMNSGLGGKAPERASTEERIARLTEKHVTDSYFEPTTVASWMTTAAQKNEPIVNLLTRMRNERPKLLVAYAQFDGSAATTWGLPSAPAQLPEISDPKALTEIDVQRFVGNTRGLASSLLALEDSVGIALSPADLQAGIQLGMTRAKAYLTARRWKRTATRPTTALVMSGGGATGAFTAGFVFRLMQVLEACHHSPKGDACPDARVDLVVGTSTGTLVGVMLDLFQVAGQEENAKKLLLDNYTCSTEKDLYCQYDEWDWHLAEHQRGLMRFDGIHDKLSKTLTPSMQGNQSELVTLAVDYDSGDLFAQSDQDPRDAASGDDRVQTVLSSIVEPVLSDPVDHLTSDGKPLPGTFIDAGVRSGLPLLEAVWRGAERTLVISTANVDIGPAAHADSALPILLRTVDLATSQNFVGELQQAELQAAARRLTEYNYCDVRLQRAGNTDAVARLRFCRRDDLWQATQGALAPGSVPIVTAHAAAGGTIGPGQFSEVANTWQSTWISRPETSGPGALGYSFDPAFMRNLFEWGVRTFQNRCQESLALFNVPPEVATADYACGGTRPTPQAFVEAKVAEVRQSFARLADCHATDHDIPACK